MQLNYLSDQDEQIGFSGGALKTNAVETVLNKVGFAVKRFTRSEFKEYFSLLGYIKAFLFGTNRAILFRKANPSISEAPIWVLNNFRQISWMPSSRNFRVIYNAHNLEFENYFKRGFSVLKYLFSFYEISQMNRTDGIFVCSEREKNIIISKNQNLSSKVFVFPNLIDSKTYRTKEHSEKDVILFVGSLNYPPNIDAVKYLCSDFSRHLDSDLKKRFNFVIAGSKPSEDLENMIKESPFELVKNFSDEEGRDLLSRAYISLVPLTHGSGTRIKIIEGIFSSNIILSTKLGSEGFQNKNIINAETESFHSKFLEIVNKDIKFDSSCNKDFYDQNDLNSWTKINTEKLNQFVSGARK